MAVVWCVHVVDGTGGGLIETPGDDHFQRAHPAAANFCLLLYYASVVARYV